jgi:hypothetical protein
MILTKWRILENKSLHNELSADIFGLTVDVSFSFYGYSNIETTAQSCMVRLLKKKAGLLPKFVG